MIVIWSYTRADPAHYKGYLCRLLRVVSSRNSLIRFNYNICVCPSGLRRLVVGTTLNQLSARAGFNSVAVQNTLCRLDDAHALRLISRTSTKGECDGVGVWPLLPMGQRAGQKHVYDHYYYYCEIKSYYTTKIKLETFYVYFVCVIWIYLAMLNSNQMNLFVTINTSAWTESKAEIS